MTVFGSLLTPCRRDHSAEEKPRAWLGVWPVTEAQCALKEGVPGEKGTCQCEPSMLWRDIQNRAGDEYRVISVKEEEPRTSPFEAGSLCMSLASLHHAISW